MAKTHFIDIGLANTKEKIAKMKQYLSEDYDDNLLQPNEYKLLLEKLYSKEKELQQLK